ncbi:ABC transporter permease subunit [Mycoplasma sp. NEAQ87857]|uniref:ABC transporter permease n=1 Tax=Mycoplasma sp. NEAQ87857 TaxID=2683967 RepID=UPI0013195640|nr:ABC transporter permease [Mycoplasma sp. NEAQ87857]QGZ97494.1 ABC transporter permease subunit [Mycoplasma sp. NEAQ87857]
MSKLRDWINKKANKIRENQDVAEINEDDDLKPNMVVQPFNYQGWKLAGKVFEYNETQHLGAQTKVFKEFVYRFSKNFAGVFGFVTIVIIFILAMILPFTTQDPVASNVFHKDLPVNSYDNSGVYHFLGTDEVGRDYWARLWWGLRYSLLLSLSVVAINVIVGVSVGIVMGQFDWFDKIITFIIKIVSNVPSILILILVTIITKPSFGITVFALTLTGWIGMALQVRAQVRRARNFEWVAASRVLGTPTIKILKNFVPVIIPILVTQLVFAIPGVILSEASLAFIGLSIKDTPTLGNLIAAGQQVFPSYLRYVFIPSTLLILITASVQLIGSSIQDALRRQR